MSQGVKKKWGNVFVGFATVLGWLLIAYAVLEVVGIAGTGMLDQSDSLVAAELIWRRFVVPGILALGVGHLLSCVQQSPPRLGWLLRIAPYALWTAAAVQTVLLGRVFFQLPGLFTSGSNAVTTVLLVVAPNVLAAVAMVLFFVGFALASKSIFCFGSRPE